MATITCANTRNAVDNAVNVLAAPGDTITIAAGDVTWTEGIVIDKPLIIEGAGTGFNGTHITSTAAAPFWLINGRSASSDDGVTEIRSIDFAGGSGGGGGGAGTAGFFRILGSDTNGWKIRIHHCRFGNIQGECFDCMNVVGVVDHCFLDGNSGVQFEIQNFEWNGRADGAGSWETATNAGGIKCMVVEDNVIHFVDGLIADGRNGFRGVFRHNTINKSGAGGAMISPHGLEGGNRSMRLCEFYDNMLEDAPALHWGNQRGGINIFFNNIIVLGQGRDIDLVFDRGLSGTHWESEGRFGGGTGKNKWDRNDLGPGSGGSNTNPNAFLHFSAEAGSANLTVQAAALIGATSYVGYTLYRTDTVATSNDPGNLAMASIITHNTSTGVITVSGDGGFAQHGGAVFNAKVGEQFDVTRIINAMEMCGMGQGSYVKGYATTPPTGWNDQLVEGCWEWNNFRKPTGSITNWGTVTNGAVGAPTVTGSAPVDCQFGNDIPVIRTTALVSRGVTYPPHCHNNTVMLTTNPAPHTALFDYPFNTALSARVGAVSWAENSTVPWSQADVASTVVVAGGDYSKTTFDGNYDHGAYPHPLVSPTVVFPSISSDSTTTFTVGRAFNCIADPKVNCFLVTTANFTGTVTIVSLTTLPSNTELVAGPTNGTAYLRGTATGVTPNTYDLSLRATASGGQQADQTFHLVIAVNQAPQNVSLSLPVAGPPTPTYNAPASINLAATASDPDGGITKIEFYKGDTTVPTNFIDKVDAPGPYEMTWTNVAAAAYTIYAKAYDTGGSSTVSTGRPIIVQAPPASLPPPTIVVTA